MRTDSVYILKLLSTKKRLILNRVIFPRLEETSQSIKDIVSAAGESMFTLESESSVQQTVGQILYRNLICHTFCNVIHI